MKKLIVVIGIIGLLAGAKIFWYIVKPEPVVQQGIQMGTVTTTQTLEEVSMQGKISPYTVLKQASLNHTDGDNLTLLIAQFSGYNNEQLRTRNFGFTSGENIYIDSATNTDATTSPIVQDCQLQHEMLHLVIAHCVSKNLCPTSMLEHSVQEYMAYDYQNICEQVHSLADDKWITIR